MEEFGLQQPIKVPGTSLLKISTTSIVEVWQYNFQEQLKKIGNLITQYNIVGMDTEFPGTCYLPQIHFFYRSSDQSENQYQFIAQNVKHSKIIQLGITLSNDKGQSPQPCCWQFNFQFDLSQDKISRQAQGLLQRAGINFKELKTKGICVPKFAQILTVTGLVLNNDIKWVVFHGGFDFAYLLNMLMGSLPNSVKQFYQLMQIFFPTIYDLKYIIKQTNLKQVGLNKLANQIHCQRIGSQHQAGSDSLLTLACYFRLRQQYQSKISFDKLSNIIFGVGSGFVSTADYKVSAQQTWPNQQQLYQYQQQQLQYLKNYSMQYMNYLYSGGMCYMPSMQENPKEKKK